MDKLTWQRVYNQTIREEKGKNPSVGKFDQLGICFLKRLGFIRLLYSRFSASAAMGRNTTLSESHEMLCLS